jgi:hypothetical protein
MIEKTPKEIGKDALKDLSPEDRDFIEKIKKENKDFLEYLRDDGKFI